MENSQILENTVLTGTAQDAAAICRKLGEDESSCRALAFACRFRGLEYVKALVENGATFKYIAPKEQGGYYKIYYWLAPLELTKAFCRGVFFLKNDDPCFSNAVQLANEEGVVFKTLEVLPIEERVEIVKYLCENKERVMLDIGEMLFYSIMSRSQKITAVLREAGAAFSEKRITFLTNGGHNLEWQEFAYLSDYLNGEEYLGNDEYIDTMKNIVKEIGGQTLHFTETIYYANYNPFTENYRLFKPECFKFILENFNQKKMNKTQIMKGAIDNDSVQCLEICAENGWLKMPRKRDEMIQYATDKGKTECTAWLLDFKNRTADLAAEREKAEKKLMRELNADPNSVTELKKIWGFENREDGSIIITKYKGNRTEIEVPAKIGKNEVTAIADYAFSPAAARLTTEQRDFRRKMISKVKLPDSIQSIGTGAFCNCWAMSECNIPESVVEIGDEAFRDCRCLTEFVIPESVKELGYKIFSGCIALRSVKLPEITAEIGNYMFANCKLLQEIKLPANIQRIGKLAFSLCGSLEEIVIPNGVTEIDQQAFEHCDLLKTVVIPASVKKMKNYTYRGQPPRTVFHASESVTVVVEPKSYAEKYCKRNEIKYTFKESEG